MNTSDNIRPNDDVVNDWSKYYKRRRYSGPKFEIFQTISTFILDILSRKFYIFCWSN